MIKERKTYITNDELCSGCPIEFNHFMRYTKNLKFEEKPDYKYMKDLIKGCANREGINLYDGIYDWNVRAVTIKNHPNVYDFIENQEVNPFDDRGNFPMNLVEKQQQ